MGKSRTIERMLEQKPEFRIFIADAEALLRAESAELAYRLDTMAVDYYHRQSWLLRDVFSGYFSDFRDMEPACAEMLRPDLQALSARIYTAESGSRQLSVPGMPVKDLELYATGRSVEMAADIWQHMDATQSDTGSGHIALGYGLRLFMGIKRSIIPDALPLSGRDITHTLCLFKLCFSEEEYVRYIPVGYQKLYQGALESAAQRMSRLLDEFGQDDISTEVFEKRSVYWEKLMSDYRRKLEELTSKQEKLLKEYSNL